MNLSWKWLLCELLLRNGELEVNVNDLFAIDWLVYCCWEWGECGICWVDDWDIEICWWLKNDLSYWDCGLKIVEMDWNDELCELFVFDGNELVV